jgi:rRNA maturation endonuclease Nob1
MADKKMAPRVESQDDIAYVTGRRSREEQNKQIRLPKHELRCSACGRFVASGATRCPHCGSPLPRE